MSKSPRKRGRGKADGRLEALAPHVHAAMTALGWVPPTDETEVRQAERNLPAEADLPETLRDPRSVFERSGARAAGGRAVIPCPGDVDIDATLARAAREGSRITPEIEQAMRRDREQAEGQSQDDEASP